MIKEEVLCDPPTAAAADFGALHDRYASALFGIALQTTGSHTQAEKPLVSTLERIWRERHGCDRSKGRLLPYLGARIRVLVKEQDFGKEHCIRGTGLHAFAEELTSGPLAVHSACFVDGGTDEAAARALRHSVEGCGNVRAMLYDLWCLGHVQPTWRTGPRGAHERTVT